MNARLTRALALVALLPLAAACETSKSSNPLSPSVAGPIPGVDISAPKPLQPTGSTPTSRSDQQPITLLIENASSSGQRPLSYRVEVAADAGFSTMVFSKDSISPGGNGRTSVQVPDKLAATARISGALARRMAPTPGRSPHVEIQRRDANRRSARRILVSPAHGETVDPIRQLSCSANADVTGPAAGISTLLQIATDQAFTHIVFSEQGGRNRTRRRVTPARRSWRSTTFYWRVRQSAAGDLTGPWSATGSFKTPVGSSEPPPPPPPPPPGGGGGGGGGGNPGNCASRDGHFIVDCISDKYTSYRRGCQSGTRRSNMEFLRNRIIEAGICGGLDLGWNLKRGGPDLSVDFIVDRRGGQEIGVDIARDYDNTSKVLQLTWAEDGPGSHYKAYSPHPSCN